MLLLVLAAASGASQWFPDKEDDGLTFWNRPLGCTIAEFGGASAGAVGGMILPALLALPFMINRFDFSFLTQKPTLAGVLSLTLVPVCAAGGAHIVGMDVEPDGWKAGSLLCAAIGAYGLGGLAGFGTYALARRVAHSDDARPTNVALIGAVGLGSAIGASVAYRLSAMVSATGDGNENGLSASSAPRLLPPTLAFSPVATGDGRLTTRSDVCLLRIRI